MIGWLLRILAVLLVLRLLARFVAGVLRGLSGGTTPAAGAARAGELVRDRVCNTYLPRSSALHARIGGRDEHFCSAACRDKALAGRVPALP